MKLPTQRRRIHIVLAALCVFAAGPSVAAQEEVIRVRSGIFSDRSLSSIAVNGGRVGQREYPAE